MENSSRSVGRQPCVASDITQSSTGCLKITPGEILGAILIPRKDNHIFRPKRHEICKMNDIYPFKHPCCQDCLLLN